MLISRSVSFNSINDGLKHFDGVAGIVVLGPTANNMLISRSGRRCSPGPVTADLSRGTRATKVAMGAEVDASPGEGMPHAMALHHSIISSIIK